MTWAFSSPALKTGTVIPPSTAPSRIPASVVRLLNSCPPMKFLNVSSFGVPLVSFWICSNIGSVPRRLFGAGGGVQDEYLNSVALAVAPADTSAAASAAAMAVCLCMELSSGGLACESQWDGTHSGCRSILRHDIRPGNHSESCGNAISSATMIASDSRNHEAPLKIVSSGVSGTITLIP